MNKKALKLFVVTAAFLFVLSGCAANNTETTTKELEDPYLYERFKTAMYNFEYTAAQEIANQIHELYPDSYDDRLAQVTLDSFLKTAEEQQSEMANVDVKNYIQLIKSNIKEPNSVGGIDVNIVWKNTSDKTIKYVTFDCDLYNAVNDIINCDITRKYTAHLQVTGPIEPETIYGKNTVWEHVWYNNSGKYIKITKIHIIYMDETEITIPENRIEELYY